MGNTDHKLFKEGGTVLLKKQKQPVLEPSEPTEPVSQVIKWCFTLNNWNAQQYEAIKAYCMKDCKKFIIGKEIGEEGTPHLQGAFYFKGKKRMSTIKKSLGIKEIHLESMNGSWNDSMTYCSKDGNYEYKDPEWEEPYDGSDLIEKDQMYMWQLELLSEFEQKPDHRKVIWCWESEGNSGKTMFSKWLCYHKNGCIIQKGKYADIMNHAFNHKNMSLFIIDVPRSSGNSVSYNAIESIKGGIIFNSKYETGQKLIKPPHIVVFANYPPDTSQLSLDRWDVREILK